MPFQARNLLMSLACSIILRMHAGDNTKPVKCMSVSLL